jgi:hypothetical protein
LVSWAIAVFPRPEDPTSRAAWERCWRRGIAGIRDEYYFGSGFRQCEVLPFLRRVLGERLRRVLFAGNGISLLPYYYAHLGYQTTAVDFARPAVKWVRRAGEVRDIATWFYEVQYDSHEDGIVRVRMDVPASRARAAETRVPGGSAAFIHADLFEYEPEQPFDAILLRCPLEWFPEAKRRELVGRLFRWTAPGGVCWAAEKGWRSGSPRERPSAASELVGATLLRRVERQGGGVQ